MTDSRKTKAQLIVEIRALRQQNEQLQSRIQQSLADVEAAKEPHQALSTLIDVGQAVASDLALEAVLEMVAQQLTELCGVEGCTLSRWDQVDNKIVTWLDWTTTDRTKVDNPGIAYPLNQYPTTQAVLENGQPALIQTNQTNSDLAEVKSMHASGDNRLLLLPMIVAGQVTGLVELYDKKLEPPFTAAKIKLCQVIANQMALIIQYATLRQQAQIQETQFQHILEAVPEGILLLDSDHRIQLTNPVAEEYLARLGGPAPGNRLEQLGSGDLRTIISPETGADVTLVDLPQGVFEVSARPVTGQAESGGWVVLIRDVTHERETQLRAKQQDRLAVVGQLAAGIAHDFNNILTSIIGYTELTLVDPSVSQTAAQDLQRVIEQSQRAAKLVRQILDFSRQSIADKQPVDLMAFINEAARLFERTLPDNIRVTLTTEIDDLPYTVNADAVQLQQALSNLVLNAQDAMPDGGRLTLALSRLNVTSETTLETALPPGQWVTLTVSDTGHGIEPEHLPHLFEPFFTTREVGQGTGLGLSQVYGIVEQHSGQIKVASQPGVGTTVSLYLPLITPPVEPNSSPKSTSYTGQGQLILLVEDSPTVLTVNRSMLEYLGYRVLIATNGQEALDLFQQHQGEVDLVLTDISMPEMDGVTLAETLHTRDKSIKIIALTGYPLNLKAGNIGKAGFIEWLRKPLTLEQLAQVVRRVLQQE
ncbi:MAG TPA: ATP-binding protein [Anaerolineae bacterium]|nr:ATP-binding protein [Anaerolineae bacterium]HMR63126.1 ATP-binding protein [Anaerolineae bacterium]